MPHQTAENGGDEQHALPPSHGQEAGLGAVLHPEDRRPGLGGSHGVVRRHGRGGCCCTSGEPEIKHLDAAEVYFRERGKFPVSPLGRENTPLSTF